MPPNLPRKFIDLIRQTSSKWVSWDPLTPIEVGTYGHVDEETGKVVVEGSIYDPAFQEDMFKHNSGIRMLDYPPRQGPVEDDIVIFSRRSQQEELDKNVDPAVADALIKGKWVFSHGRRSAIFIMHRPRQTFLQPHVVLEPLYKVDKLMDKWLVTSKYECSAYSMYLSDKSGDKVSLALIQKPAAAKAEGADNGLSWWCDDPRGGLLQSACDPTGEYKFTPLFGLKRPIRRNRRFFRDRIMPEPAGDELWYADSAPWDPLDEDGGEDPLDPEIKAMDPFAEVDKAAAEKAAKEKAEEEILEAKRAILRASGAPF